MVNQRNCLRAYLTYRWHNYYNMHTNAEQTRIKTLIGDVTYKPAGENIRSLLKCTPGLSSSSVTSHNLPADPRGPNLKHCTKFYIICLLVCSKASAMWKKSCRIVDTQNLITGCNSGSNIWVPGYCIFLPPSTLAHLLCIPLYWKNVYSLGNMFQLPRPHPLDPPPRVCKLTI